MPAGGDSRFRRVPLVSGSHLPLSARRAPRARPLSRGALVHRRSHPGTPRDTTPRPRAAAPQHTNRTCSGPASRFCAGRIISQKPTKPTSIGSSRLIHVSVPRGTLYKSSTSSMRPKTSTRLTRRWDGSPICTPPARFSNTARSSTRSSLGEKRSWPITAADEHRTDP